MVLRLKSSMLRIFPFLLLSLSVTPAYACETGIYALSSVRVIDGDTIKADVELGLGLVLRGRTIRLQGIDSPEVRGVGAEEKEAGLKARDFLKQRLDKAGTLTVRLKPGAGKVGSRRGGGSSDKYGRLIGVLYADGANLNELLVSSGMAVRRGE